MVRGLSHSFVAVIDSRTDLRSKRRKNNETEKLLSKLKEMVEAMDSGKKYGLDHNSGEFGELGEEKTISIPTKSASLDTELEKAELEITDLVNIVFGSCF